MDAVQVCPKEVHLDNTEQEQDPQRVCPKEVDLGKVRTTTTRYTDLNKVRCGRQIRIVTGRRLYAHNSQERMTELATDTHGIAMATLTAS
jgi:hypothetical protein